MSILSNDHLYAVYKSGLSRGTLLRVVVFVKELRFPHFAPLRVAYRHIVHARFGSHHAVQSYLIGQSCGGWTAKAAPLAFIPGGIQRRWLESVRWSMRLGAHFFFLGAALATGFFVLLSAAKMELRNYPHVRII